MKNCKNASLFLTQILSGFECLWSEALKMSDSMSQLQLLRLLITLVETAGDAVTTYVPSFIGIIHYELTEAGTDSLDLFLEDGLILWNNLIHLSNLTYSPEIHTLFVILIHNYSRNMKLFTTVMGLIDGYVSLGK